jgi:predicted XRE-type DNA-binding protein
MSKKFFVSKDNVFEDLGLDDSEEMRARSDLLSEVVYIIRKSGLPQKEVAVILNISQPKTSALLSGKINDFSTDTLMQYLTLLGCCVEIRVQPRHRLSRTVKRGKMVVQKRTSIKRRKLTAKS